MIDYGRLGALLGFDTYDHVQSAHRKWVDSYLENGENIRDGKWPSSVGVGSQRFIKNIKELMGGLVLGRKSIESGESFQLREAQNPYSTLFDTQKDAIARKNSCSWN